MGERSRTSGLRGETRTPPFTAAVSERLARVTALCLVLALGCGGSAGKSNTAAARRTGPPSELMSYRLLLRDNPVDPGEAFRCYGHCQDRTTPKAYVECLQQCPGFEIDPGMACDEHDVPPAAACLTVRKIPLTK